MLWNETAMRYTAQAHACDDVQRKCQNTVNAASVI